ncbi:MAG: holo-acyl-carrier-protein synthase [Bacillota bacterium]|jgi:phosphopantetheine--protein transferase-like protein|nr:holo-acyl-carrier-protein synthase [Bacillota bacterium]
MIYGIGVDLFQVSRMLNFETCLEDPFYLNAYTPAERKQGKAREDSTMYFATRFAGKEAVYKAISRCGYDFRPKDIEIIDKDDGRPEAKILGKTDQYFREHVKGKLILHVSLSYETKYAEAFALAEIQNGGEPYEHDGKNI